MGASKTLPVSLPLEMLENVTQLAKKEHRTKSELVREALRRYIEDEEWATLRAYGTRKAKALGIQSDEDIVRLVREVRKERRAKVGQHALDN